MTLWSVVVRTLITFEPAPGLGRRSATGGAGLARIVTSVVPRRDRARQLVGRRVGVSLEPGDVGVVLGLRDDLHGEAHAVVLLPAQLGAATGVGALAGGRELEGVQPPRHHVAL